MHERTQRDMARLLFVVCCAVPTFVILLIIAVTLTPWYHQKQLHAITTSIAKDTGFRIEIEDFDRPTPSRLSLNNVRIFDPETRHEIAKIYRVEWTNVNNGVSMVLHQPELQSSQLSSAWRLMHDRFLCQSICLTTPVRFAANDLTIHSGAGSTTLRDVDAWIEPGADQTLASVECLPVDLAGDDGSVRIEVVRDRSGLQPNTRWLMESNSTALPCSALSQYSDFFGSLGPDAMFSGTFAFSSDALGWSIDLAGTRLSNVDLGTLFERMPHQLTGNATIAFTRGVVKPGEAVDVIGEIRASDGVAGTTLLAALEQNLSMTVSADLQNPRPVPYDLLALQFQIFGSQLALDGLCRTERGYEGLPSGVVLCTDGYPLVQARQKKMAAIELLKVIAPSHSAMVPLSGQTTKMMQWLLPPSLKMPSGEQQELPRLGSLKDYSGGPAINQPALE